MLSASICDDKRCILKVFKACVLKYYVQYYDFNFFIICADCLAQDTKLIAHHLYWAILIE